MWGTTSSTRRVWYARVRCVDVLPTIVTRAVESSQTDIGDQYCTVSECRWAEICPGRPRLSLPHLGTWHQPAFYVCLPGMSIHVYPPQHCQQTVFPVPAEGLSVVSASYWPCVRLSVGSNEELLGLPVRISTALILTVAALGHAPWAWQVLAYVASTACQCVSQCSNCSSRRNHLSPSLTNPHRAT